MPVPPIIQFLPPAPAASAAPPFVQAPEPQWPPPLPETAHFHAAPAPWASSGFPAATEAAQRAPPAAFAALPRAAGSPSIRPGSSPSIKRAYYQPPPIVAPLRSGADGARGARASPPVPADQRRSSSPAAPLWRRAPSPEREKQPERQLSKTPLAGAGSDAERNFAKAPARTPVGVGNAVHLKNVSVSLPPPPPRAASPPALQQLQQARAGEFESQQYSGALAPPRPGEPGWGTWSADAAPPPSSASADGLSFSSSRQSATLIGESVAASSATARPANRSLVAFRFVDGLRGAPPISESPPLLRSPPSLLSPRSMMLSAHESTHGAACPTCHGSGAVEMPLPPGWTEARSALNGVYYVHTATREVVVDSFALPAAHARITSFLAELGLATLAERSDAPPPSHAHSAESLHENWEPRYASKSLEGLLSSERGAV
jgi:hypothetical protein